MFPRIFALPGHRKERRRGEDRETGNEDAARYALVVFASSTRYFGLWRPQAVFGEETAEFLLLVQKHSQNIENLSGRNFKKSRNSSKLIILRKEIMMFAFWNLRVKYMWAVLLPNEINARKVLLKFL